MTSSTLDDGEAEGEHVPSAAGSAQEHCAVYDAEEHGFLETDRRQLKDRKGSLCPTCALIATDTRLKITSGGLDGAR